MHIATVENLPAQSNRAVSNSWRIRQGAIWGGLAVVVVSGWFVVARLGLRQDLRVWDVMALRFGEGALFLTPVLLVGPLRLRVQAWPSGIIALGAASLPPRPIRITKREKANDPLLFSPDAQPRESRADARRDRLGLSSGPD